MHVTEDNLKAFKQHMNIYHSHADERLKGLLESSYLFVKGKCGDFNLSEFNQGTELVYERARYAFHDSLEYFDENFMSMMHNFALNNLPLDKEGDDDEAESE